MLIPKSIYQSKDKSKNDSTAELSLWLREKKIDFFVKIGVSDQTLCFNPSVSTDLVALLNYCKQQGDKPLYLAEALIDHEDGLIDQNGKKYVAEFVINFYHNTQIYNSIIPKKALSIADNTSIPAHYLPASEWLYFEIYINPSKSNALLCNEICSLLKAHKDYIYQWFFVRYHENGKHLRLRLKVKNAEKRSLIIDHFNRLFTIPTLKGIVDDVSIKTYYPEIARYGHTRIFNVELFFCLDSTYVLSLLKKARKLNHFYIETMFFLNKITFICFPLFSDRLFFVKQMAELFKVEFNINQKSFKKINQLYATLQQDKYLNGSHKQLEDCAQSIFMLCNETEKSKMLTDLIHMHINRLFNDRQRLHEAVCYQFLYKQLLTERARLIAPSGTPSLSIKY